MKLWYQSWEIAVSSLLAISVNLWLKPEIKAAEINLETVRIEDTEWFLEGQQKSISQLSNGTKGKVLAIPYPDSSSDREADFRNFLRTLDPQGQEEWDVQQRITSYGYDVLYATGFMDFQGTAAYLVPVAVFSREQMYTFTLVAPRSEDRDLLKQSFGNLLGAIRFSEAPVATGDSQSDGSLDGFYVAIGAKTGVSVLARVQVEVGAKGLWLQPNGRYALTESGIVGDFDAYCKRLPKNCGRYEINNGQYSTWRAGSTNDAQLQLYKQDRQPFARSGEDLIIGKTKYRYVAPVSNLKLAGDYRLISADATGNTSGYLENVYGFNPDGRFVRGGSVAMFGNFGSSSIQTSGNRQPRTGTYEINGYTLTLKFDDGETQTKAFFLLDEVPVIEGELYEKLN